MGDGLQEVVDRSTHYFRVPESGKGGQAIEATTETNRICDARRADAI